MGKKKVSVADAGHLGGKKTSQTHSHDFYVEIGMKGAAKRSENKKARQEATS